MSDLGMKLDGAASFAKPVHNLKAAGENEKVKIETAKNFESLLLGQLVSAMKDTVDESQMTEDNAGKQINDMFYSFLSDNMASNGGMGIWKEIYSLMNQNDSQTSLLDESV